MQRIDFEKTPKLNFTLIAYDSGVPQFSSSAEFLVNIINVNDKDPVFNQVCVCGVRVTFNDTFQLHGNKSVLVMTKILISHFHCDILDFLSFLDNFCK